MDSDDRPVLVTGGAGFAGSYVVRRLLDDGERPVVFDLSDYRPESRFVVGPQAGAVPFERGSIDNWPRVMEVVQRYRPKAIVHLAMIMDVPMLDRNPLLALTVNVGGACTVFEAARLFGVDRVVTFSTIAVHGKRIYEPIDADHPTVTARVGPVGAYSAAKLSMEAFAFAYADSFGLDVKIVRPSALYGFGMSWMAPNYMKNIVEPALLGQPVRLATGGPVPRDYANVVDLAGLTAAILRGRRDTDRVVDAGTGQPLRTGGDVGQIVRDLVPGAAIEVGDAWTDDDRAEQVFRGRISVDNAREQLGWQPQFADLKAGVADYVARFRAFQAAGGRPTPPPEGLKAPGSG